MIRIEWHPKWAATVSDERHSLQVATGWPHLAWWSLTEAVIHLLRGMEQAVAYWEDEPGPFRWVFQREGELVRLQILWFDRAFTRVSDENGKVELETRCRLADLAGQTLSQLQRVLDAANATLNQRAWTEEQLPVRLYADLRQLVREHKRRRHRLAPSG